MSTRDQKGPPTQRRWRQGAGTVEIDPTTVEATPAPLLPDDPFADTDHDTHVVRLHSDLEPVDVLPPGISAQLEVLDGSQRGTKFLLDEPYMTIGRNPANDVVLTDSSVSGTHAAICFANTREWRVKDLGSTNGTLLNGSRVLEFALRSGDKLIMGDTLLQFLVDH